MKHRLLNLMIVCLLLAACGSSDDMPKIEATSTPTGTNQYDCFAQAYEDLGAAALPKPLPSTVGADGERIYSLTRPDGETITMTVYSLGPLSYAPGEHFIQGLANDGWFTTIRLQSGKEIREYKNIKNIDLYVLNEGYHTMPPEIKKITDRWPKQYTLLGVDQALTLHTMIPFFAAADQAGVEQTYNAFVERQTKHRDDLWPSIISSLTTARDADRSSLSQICQDHIKAYWQKQLDDTIARQAAGEAPLAGEGNLSHLPDPTVLGDWNAVIVVHVSPYVYVGADDRYVQEGKFVKYYRAGSDGKADEPVYYTIEGHGLFVAAHEFGHAFCGKSEDCADQLGLRWVQGWRERIEHGDFRADLIPIDADTGEVALNGLEQP